MTAAGAHFAKVEEQKKAELEKLRENPEPMPAGQAYFTNKAREERNQTVEGQPKGMARGPAGWGLGQSVDMARQVSIFFKFKHMLLEGFHPPTGHEPHQAASQMKTNLFPNLGYPKKGVPRPTNIQ
ncbi:hypothetical protein THAOC_25518 [Thalassiosira oceanica]|uniref:Uncharacterized protein n=1 Tax=Thalassiosira oceanica TaxID=159749 RepID=K0S7M8_THAOC|nr:hypothetical protein THAOC_25518 [Thalassiosira oceanica]|eukprot:EJK54822.1 hypothetical protein THAOC_25518 [Thalassiosira oceanica]